MTTEHTHQIVSANDLLNGHVIYLTDQDDWSRHPDQAAIFQAGAAAEAALAQANQSPERAVGPYLIDVSIDDDHSLPTHHREVIRRNGPTVGDLNSAPHGSDNRMKRDAGTASWTA